jgi:hypothetical protein
MVEDGIAAAKIASKQKHSPAREDFVASWLILVRLTLSRLILFRTVPADTVPADTGSADTVPADTGSADYGPADIDTGPLAVRTG